MQKIVCFGLTLVAVLSAGWTAAQPPSRPRATEPVELGGPPKKPHVVTPAIRTLADTSVPKLDIQDTKAVAGAVRKLSSLILQFSERTRLVFCPINRRLSERRQRGIDSQ
jgi:hypothetical protein